MANESKERDLVLAPNQYAFILDRQKGKVSPAVGPVRVTPSDPDIGVVYNPSTKRFDPVPQIIDAIQTFPFAEEGSYIVLENPAQDGKHPSVGNGNELPPLAYGRKINIPGPVLFPLWPGQVSKEIKGHTLLSNQYLVVSVYSAEAARQNWGRGSSIPPTKQNQNPNPNPNPEDKKSGESGENPQIPTTAIQTTQPAASTGMGSPNQIDPNTLVTGMKLVIRGTDVSFYIPPTGIEVLEDPDYTPENGRTEHYVRSAVTLENLQYAILKDQQGKTRYERGPKVVFPSPTEVFAKQKNEEDKYTRRFRAYTLTPLQGIHVQVLENYNDDGSPVTAEKTDHMVGEELFIRGSEQAIYYPRPEHAIVKYDDQDVYNSVLVPEGEGRYVADRRDGTIELVVGPKMLLPDPRTHVLVRRALTDAEVDLYFPSNAKAKAYNAELRAMAETEGVSNANFVSDNTVRRRSMNKLGEIFEEGAAALESMTGAKGLTANMLTASAAPSATAYAFSNIRTARPEAADQIKRGTNFTPPRQITLDTRFDGAVSIRPYVGFAVKVVSKTGKSRVVAHPEVALLEYDESLQTINFSMGTPKVEDRLFKTVYLRVFNNKVSDKFFVETSDMCKLEITVGMRVNFEGEKDKWFAVDNYVKLLCEHVRSKVASAVKRIPIQQFYSDATSVIRNTILGESAADRKRPGMMFEENGMRVYEVEVSNIVITDNTIATMISKAAIATFQSNMEVNDAQRRLDTTKRTEEIEQQIVEIKNSTAKAKITAEMNLALAKFEQRMAEIKSALQVETENMAVQKSHEAITDFSHKSGLERQRQTNAVAMEESTQQQKLAVEMLEAEVSAIKEKFGAFSGPWAEALLAIASQDNMVKIRQAMTPIEILGGQDVASTLGKILENSGLRAAWEETVKGGGAPIGAASLSASTAASGGGRIPARTATGDGR